jgi:cytidyltransferase-like protein
MRYGVLAHGCFDLLHIGHIRYLQWAKSQLPSAPLIVTLTADAFISKGDGRPAFAQDIRAETVAALECVDYVSIVDDPTGLPAIAVTHPAVYAKGRGVEPLKMQKEQEAVEALGGRVAFMPEQEIEISSTEILSGDYLRKRKAA